MKDNLRMMWSYYGGKWRSVPRLYPPPAHDTIVEPFAGAAGYSLRYASRKVVLCDLDPIVSGLWQYLIRVSPDEIMALPDVEPGQTVDDINVPQEAKWLIGFYLNAGVASPRRTPSAWMRSGMRPGFYWGDAVRRKIASQLQHIRHWKVINCCYDECPFTGPATWFIDPPYQVAGKYYRFGSKKINYGKLADWCRTRQGQVIVCENEGADWLPFTRIGSIKSSIPGRVSKEVAWIRDITLGEEVPS